MGLTVWCTPEFQRDYKKLSAEVKTLFKVKWQLFCEHPHHPLLKTHALTGSLRGQHAFSIDFRHRVIFQFIGKEEAVFLRIGDHSIYRKKKD